MAEVEVNERRIVVAVDEGEESMYALSWCLKNVISRDSKDTLILLYAKPPCSVYPAIDGTGYLFSSDIIASMKKYRTDVADCVMEKANNVCKDIPNIKVQTKVGNGDPRDVICEVVEKLAADLLVVGTHGYGFIKRAFLGSVSNHCAQNVKCPILIVKMPKSVGTSSFRK
ncbi:universal stress protein A-like protein isoform X2 [Telopea speciosissima]|uniref:universal stress protein A-like protein isoform X2 n=1 Tax=Telopea speciosissima TaxID=54955 RepID=UPI001CC67E05|nr:universal stress protein A-like protein isoform X2 [Telopea speciosissima]